MKNISAATFSLLLLFCLSTNQALACTTFCLKNKGEVLFGKNYDWMIGDGLLFVNKRGVSKISTSEATDNPAKWTSKYGSVTFNQYGRENPSGGMNEAGLVIELMWLDDTQYPKPDARPTVGTLEWIQYQLDNSATVGEVMTNAEKIRIASEVKIHYLINDKNGNSTTVEFLDGKLVAHMGDKLSVSALANDTYEKSWTYAKEMQDFGGSKTIPQTPASLDRFTRAAQKTKEFEKQAKTEREAVNYAFGVLSDVAQKGYTQWSIVYDQKRGKIYFRTMQSRQIKSVDTTSFDYSCDGGAVKIFDINSNESGDVSAKFVEYTRRANRDLIERAFNGTPFLKNIPALIRDGLAAYPENFGCAAKLHQTAAAVENPDELDNFLSGVRPLQIIFREIASSRLAKV